MATASPAPEALAVRLAYTPHRPTEPQHAFLLLDELGIPEALYGGAAGGGKTDALLMSAARYVDVKGYAALLLRRTFADLELADALIPRSLEWWADTDAVYDANRYRWTFPSGAIVQFGYLATERHKYRYQGSAWQFIGVDELTQIPMADYRYLFSRLRKPSDPDNPLSRVPLRMSAASNPGGLSHEAVKRRLVERLTDDDDPEDTPARARRRIFIPAKLSDNPHVDQESYIAGLLNLDKVTREQLMHGRWDVDTGDRIYPPRGIDAAVSRGIALDELARAGQVPPPVGGLVALGLDWGDRKWCIVGWPLEGGGMWIVAAFNASGLEVTAATDAYLELLPDLPRWPNRGKPRDPLDLVGRIAYDSAGLESQKTFNRVARRRRPRLRVTAVPFAKYKREAINYVRLLLERAEEDKPDGILAISRDERLVDPLFVTQLRNLRKDPKDPELPVKPGQDAEDTERDDGPDAMLALIAPVAKVNRGRYSRSDARREAELAKARKAAELRRRRRHDWQ